MSPEQSSGEMVDGAAISIRRRRRFYALSGALRSRGVGAVSPGAARDPDGAIGGSLAPATAVVSRRSTSLEKDRAARFRRGALADALTPAM